MIKVFLMLIALIMINGLSTDIVEAADLDYENQDLLIPGNYVNVQDIEMTDTDFKNDSAQPIQLDEVITDINLLGPHQVGFTVENIAKIFKECSETLTNQYSQIKVSKAVVISQFDFG